MFNRRYGFFGPKKNKNYSVPSVPSVQIIRVENPINETMIKENKLLKQPWLVV